MAYWDYIMQDGYLAPTAESVSKIYEGFTRDVLGMAYNTNAWNFTSENEGYPYIANTEYRSRFIGDINYLETELGIFSIADAKVRKALDGYIPNEGNTTSDNLEIKRNTVYLGNNAENDSHFLINNNNGGLVHIEGVWRTYIMGGDALIDMDDYILLRPGPNQKAYYGNDSQGLRNEMEIATIGNLSTKLDKTGGQLTGQLTTTQTLFTEDNQLVTKKYVDDNAGSGTTVYEIGTPDYDNRIQFTQADLPYTVPCDGYLYIGGWQSRVSLKFKDTNNNYVNIAFASTSGAIAEYGMYPVTKGMVLEYNEIDGTEAKMYIVPMEYNAMSIGRGVEELYVASDTTAPNTITLSQPYTNFDELMFIRHWGSPATSEASFANVADINVGDVLGVSNWAGGKFVEYTVTSTTVLTKTDSGQDGYIYKIYGIKYASKYAKVDDEMSDTSENPVQNKVIKDYIDKAIAAITDYESEVFPNE